MGDVAGAPLVPVVGGAVVAAGKVDLVLLDGVHHLLVPNNFQNPPMLDN